MLNVLTSSLMIVISIVSFLDVFLISIESGVSQDNLSGYAQSERKLVTFHNLNQHKLSSISIIGSQKYNAPNLHSLTSTLPIAPEQTPTPHPPTETPQKKRKPTATPLVIPPPSDPNITHWMVAIGVVVVIIILIGLWLNRNKI